MTYEFSLYACPACGWRHWVTPEDDTREPINTRHDRESAHCDRSLPIMLVASIRQAVIDRTTTLPEAARDNRTPCKHYERGAGGALRFCKLPAGHDSRHELMT